MVSIQVKAFKTGKDRPFVMNREAAEQVIAAYQKSLYGFALKRCAGLQDAEDLAQEICLRLYRTLLLREDIEDVERFIWTVAHNAQVNYYRGRQRAGIGIGLEEMEEPAAEEDLQILLAEKLKKAAGVPPGDGGSAAQRNCPAVGGAAASGDDVLF